MGGGGAGVEGARAHAGGGAGHGLVHGDQGQQPHQQLRAQGGQPVQQVRHPPAGRGRQRDADQDPDPAPAPDEAQGREQGFHVPGQQPGGRGAVGRRGVAPHQVGPQGQQQDQRRERQPGQGRPGPAPGAPAAQEHQDPARVGGHLDPGQALAAGEGQQQPRRGVDAHVHREPLGLRQDGRRVGDEGGQGGQGRQHRQQGHQHQPQRLQAPAPGVLAGVAGRHGEGHGGLEQQQPARQVPAPQHDGGQGQARAEQVPADGAVGPFGRRVEDPVQEPQVQAPGRAGEQLGAPQPGRGHQHGRGGAGGRADEGSGAGLGVTSQQPSDEQPAPQPRQGGPADVHGGEAHDGPRGTADEPVDRREEQQVDGVHQVPGVVTREAGLEVGHEGAPGVEVQHGGPQGPQVARRLAVGGAQRPGGRAVQHRAQHEQARHGQHRGQQRELAAIRTRAHAGSLGLRPGRRTWAGGARRWRNPPPAPARRRRRAPACCWGAAAGG